MMRIFLLICLMLAGAGRLSAQNIANQQNGGKAIDKSKLNIHENCRDGATNMHDNHKRQVRKLLATDNNKKGAGQKEKKAAKKTHRINSERNGAGRGRNVREHRMIKK